MTEPVSMPVSADAVADAVAALPQVRLHSGGPAATHLPGRRIGGVRLTARAAEVHVVVVYPTTVDEAATAVRGALTQFDLARVDVVVEDVVRPEDVLVGGSSDEPSPHADDTGGSHE